MELDFSPRRAGKTTRMIKWLLGSPYRLLITFSRDEENRLKNCFPEVRNQIIDWQSYLRAYRNHYFNEVAIDNAELVLQNALQLQEPIKRISICDTNKFSPSMMPPRFDPHYQVFDRYVELAKPKKRKKKVNKKSRL